jgi:hypothetical protein
MSVMGSRSMRGHLATGKAIAVAAVATLLMAGCGPAVIKAGNSTPPPSAPATTATAQADAAVCQDVAALHASVDRVLSYQPGKSTIASLKSDLSDASTKLVALRQRAHETLSAQTGPLAAAVRNAQGAVTASVGTGQVADIMRTLGDVRAKAQSLFAAAKAYCPSSAS